MNININQLKRQLNIESSYIDDDALLQQYLAVSEESVKSYLGASALTGYTETTIPVSIEQAVILLASHFYLNRNMVSFGQGYEIPYSFQFLLNPYREIIIN